jgi:uncharacterized protein YoxC
MIIMVISCGTLALVLILRRQICTSLDDLQQTATRIEELGDSVAGTPSSKSRWQDRVRKAARAEKVEGLHTEQAKRIDDLRKVEKERIVVCRRVSLGALSHLADRLSRHNPLSTRSVLSCSV